VVVAPPGPRHNIEGQVVLTRMLLPLCAVLSVESPLLSYLTTFMVELPFSRTLEEEADHVAMIILARACEDPAELPLVMGALANRGWAPLTVRTRNRGPTLVSRTLA
jgi:Zn-dependent protease with chaperone function